MNCRLCNQGLTQYKINPNVYGCVSKHYNQHYRDSDNILVLETFKLLPTAFEIIIFSNDTPNNAEIWVDNYTPLFGVPVGKLPLHDFDKLVEKIRTYILFS
jgi:hypothetical protein